MTLRAKLAVAMALSVAVAVALASATGYVLIAEGLQRSVDESLRQQLGAGTAAATAVRRGTLPPRVRAVLESRGQGEVVQVVGVDGTLNPAGGPPVSAGDLALARARRRTALALRDDTAGGAPVRVGTVGLPQGGALRVAVDVSGDRDALSDLRRRLAGLSIAGALAAGAVGWVLARRLTAPLARLSAVAEHVAATEDLSTPVVDDRPDEVGRLSRSLATMLAALATSRAQQQRLVEDAGHELRTPLTSLRTNLEVLEQADRLPEADRARLVADLRAEVDELTALVAEIVAVAAAHPGGRTPEPREEHDLAVIAAAVAERHRRRTGRDVRVDAEPAPAVVAANDVERAISNLVDNALKLSRTEAPVVVEVRDGRVAVFDEGPGIPPAEAGRIFDRFYRTETARSTPGSGLGLAIVAEVARAHGGACFAHPRPDGRQGSVVGFTLAPTKRAGPAPEER